MSTLIVSFPGGKRADAQYKGFSIRTDQSQQGGGEGGAPEPFDLFLASIVTCAGVYVKGYCDAREIPTNGLTLEMQVERDAERHRVSRIVVEINARSTAWVNAWRTRTSANAGIARWLSVTCS